MTLGKHVIQFVRIEVHGGAAHLGGVSVIWYHREIRKIILEALFAIYQILTSTYHVTVCEIHSK